MDKRVAEDEWMQLFLRNDGHNLELADGLLRQERPYIGIRRIPLSLLAEIKSGAPEYLHDRDSIDCFFQMVVQKKRDDENWDTLLLIVEYGEKGFHVDDGRHRLEMYRQMGITHAPAALWTAEELRESRLIELLEDCR